ncbi:MAG: replication-associated recombination protein A, partial [Phycisphaerae bacterium]
RGGDGAASPGRGGGGVVVDLDVARACMQRKVMHYDVGGDDHYDTISAMIKSMRGGDPDAAVYWLARMLEAGEDPRYIARRIVICAAEDVGTADAQALVVAQSAADATLFVGLPECQFPLAQAAIYVACAPKSNACARAILDARNAVREGTTIPVPRHLRSAGYAGARILKRGVGYRYPHDRPDGIVAQEYLGVDRVFYHPANHGAEANMRQADAAQQRVPHPSDER